MAIRDRWGWLPKNLDFVGLAVALLASQRTRPALQRLLRTALQSAYNLVWLDANAWARYRLAAVLVWFAILVTMRGFEFKLNKLIFVWTWPMALVGGLLLYYPVLWGAIIATRKMNERVREATNAAFRVLAWLEVAGLGAILIPVTNDHGLALLAVGLVATLWLINFGEELVWPARIKRVLGFAVPVAVAIILVILFMGGREEAQKQSEESVTAARQTAKAAWDQTKAAGKAAAEATKDWVGGLSTPSTGGSSRRNGRGPQAPDHAVCADAENHVFVPGGGKTLRINTRMECWAGWLNTSCYRRAFFQSVPNKGLWIEFADGFRAHLPPGDESWFGEDRVGNPPGQRHFEGHGKRFRFCGEGPVIVSVDAPICR